VRSVTLRIFKFSEICYRVYFSYDASMLNIEDATRLLGLSRSPGWPD
jgi:hypothetical protein